MPRRRTTEPATVREARDYLLDHAHHLPEGIYVGSRGRLSQAAKDYFTNETGREVIAG